VVCLPEDGARLAALSYGSLDLLTGPPAEFRPPAADYGRYETRPVYGYDDCFPSVDPCAYPQKKPAFQVPDHGELCWLHWEVQCSSDALLAQTRSRMLPVLFRRTLHFSGRTLIWRFEVVNRSGRAVPFLHVMHALLPLDRVAGIRLPGFAELYDEMEDRRLAPASPADLARDLLAAACGTARMLLLRRVREGRFEVSFRTGERLVVTYPAGVFPTLGIWWNRGGYPDEDGCRRVECALEPIPGTFSSLARSWAEGVCAVAPPRGEKAWSVVWSVEA